MGSSTSALSTLLLFLLLILLQFAQFGIAKSTPSFCPLTLSRPTCPDLPTYDAFDITTYGGRWFEIGSSANFKNLQESGGICVIANYTLLQPPSPGKGAVIGVLNTEFSTGAPSHNVSQVVISISAGDICAQAFDICAETDLKSSSNLTQGLALVSNVGSQCPGFAAALASSTKQIEGAVRNIDQKLDELSKGVTGIQELDAQLGQAQGSASDNVAALEGTVAELNGTAITIATVGTIQSATEKIGKIAAQLESDGDDANSAKLYKAMGLISAADGAIAANLAQIQGSLAGILGVVGLFLAPFTGPKGYDDARIVGAAVQNSSFAGKLEIKFPGITPGQYWVVAVEEGGPDGGYAATLVYGCDENSSGGGIEETLFVLSRTPTLPEASVNRLLAKGAALGVTGICSTPFIFTVQSPSCGNPPDLPPYYHAKM